LLRERDRAAPTANTANVRDLKARKQCAPKLQSVNEFRRADGPRYTARRVQTRMAKSHRQRRSRVVSVEKSLPRVNPDIVWTPVAEGAVLFSTTSELYYGANQVAAYVWEQLQSSNETFEELCAAIHQRFPDAPPDELCADVRELLDDFARHGLVGDVAA
jgi:coenzyme PQQ synthesis protein D (PqqD)